MKKKIVLIVAIVLGIALCFFGFKKFYLDKKNKAKVAENVDETSQSSIDTTAIETVAASDTLQIDDTSSNSENKDQQEELDKWLKKTKYYIKKKNYSKAKSCYKQLKVFTKDKKMLEGLKSQIDMIKNGKSSSKKENTTQNWIIEKVAAQDTTYYVIKNSTTGLKLSNRYYSKEVAEKELENFKSIIK